jgi:hypothetical protein
MEYQKEAYNYTILDLNYYIHFEINGVSCNLNSSQDCDFSPNSTPNSAIRAEIVPSFNQSH